MCERGGEGILIRYELVDVHCGGGRVVCNTPTCIVIYILGHYSNMPALSSMNSVLACLNVCYL